MSDTERMLQAYPGELAHDDAQLLAHCVEACVECSQVCTACADACLAEKSVADLVTCIGRNLDCADVCRATAAVVSRQVGSVPDVTRAVLEACVHACRSCGDQCQLHASMHEHCSVCADACRACEQACVDLLAALG